MYYTTGMSAQFEAEKNRRAFLYTAAIVAAILLIAFLYKWQMPKLPKETAQDLIEINLGNFDEGMGEVQPLIKGEKAPDAEPEQSNTSSSTPTNTEPEAEKPVEETNDADAAPIKKTVTTPTPIAKPNPTPSPIKNNTPTTNTTPAPTPKPQKPKIAGYGGPKDGKGNGATEDNGYTMQGNNKNGKGDAGDPNGNKDSYGNNPGGRVAGGTLRVSKGDRKIINNYIFMGDLPKATINAVIKVSPDGRGTFITFDKGSTSADQRYAAAIRSYLPNIQFDKADHESVVTVPFNFRVQ